MRAIQMVDLYAQHMRLKDLFDDAIEKIIRNSAFINGDNVTGFEKALQNYLNIPYVISCGNGTDALQIALMALNLERGDEVITTPLTFVATVEVIALLGLKPVFVDIDPQTCNINPDLIERAITKRTRCILPVHLYGQPADMEPILDIANRHNLYVIEDNAQAIGAHYTFSNGTTYYTGTMGQIGCTSFYPSKNLGCMGDGGAIFTKNQALAQKIRMIANHGGLSKYHYDVIGVNSRLDAIQAAILNIKLKHLDDYNARRIEAANLYDTLLADVDAIDLPVRKPNVKHVFHQYTIRVKNGKRDELKQWLAGHNIPSMIYYPSCLHLEKAYAYLGYKQGDFPEAERAASEVLSPPMHPELDGEQIHTICQTIKTFFNRL